MSASKKLIVNCGAGHLTASVFSVNNGTLLLERFAHVNLEYDLSQEDLWLSAVSDAMRSLPSGFKDAGPVSYVLPGYLALTKAIKVPYVEEAKRRQVITFEATQQMPYPLHEVVWDYQIIADDGIEIEVVVIAVKRDMINDFCKRMQQDGFPPAQIGAAAVLDRNAYQLAHSADSQDSLLIDIGARSTNMLFIGERGSYIRSLSWGGNSLTQSIADTLGIPFSQADKLKIAYFSGQTRLTDGDKNTEALRQNAEAFQRRLGQEITRSVVNYRRQYSAPAPSRIFITGRGASLPGLDASLEASQRVPVSAFDPVSAISVGSEVNSADLDAFRTSMNSVVGMALIGVMPDAYNINLLPPELVERRRVSRQKPFLFLAAALLALATLPPYYYYTKDASGSVEDTTAFSTRTRPLESLHREIREISDEAKTTAASIAALEGLVDSRSNWIQFLADTQTRMEQVTDVWLESMNLNRSTPNRLEVSGRMLLRDYNPERPGESATAGYARVESLIQGITQSEFVNGVAEQTFNSSNPRILAFTFVLELNPEKPL